MRDHHTISGSTGTGRITADNSRAGFVGDPEAGIFAHPTIVAGVPTWLDDGPTGDRPGTMLRRAGSTG